MTGEDTLRKKKSQVDKNMWKNTISSKDEDKDLCVGIQRDITEQIIQVYDHEECLWIPLSCEL